MSSIAEVEGGGRLLRALHCQIVAKAARQRFRHNTKRANYCLGPDRQVYCRRPALKSVHMPSVYSTNPLCQCNAKKNAQSTNNEPCYKIATN